MKPPGNLRERWDTCELYAFLANRATPFVGVARFVGLPYSASAATGTPPVGGFAFIKNTSGVATTKTMAVSRKR